MSASQTATEYISLNELCQKLSISTATGRNWLKLKKIIPQTTIKRTAYFTNDYLLQLQDNLKSGKNLALKSRRNKKYVSGTNIYNSYVSDTSAAQNYVQEILNYLEAHDISPDSTLINTLIAECAAQIILRDTILSASGNCLESYLTGAISLNGYEFLIDDLLDDKSASLDFIHKHQDLFYFTYQYEVNEDVLGLLYISTKNLHNRKATGSYYTPTKVVKQLCAQLFTTNTYAGSTILDPCCGTGNFLLQLPQDILFDNIYANDTDSTSIKITRINLAIKYSLPNKELLYTHITEQNYLEHKFTTKFDFIIGNPPWGYNYTDEEKAVLRTKYASAIGTNIESFDIFIEQALKDLKTEGVLSFVLPEAILNVKTHLPIRKILLKQCSFQYLNFLGNAFDKVQCPCIILQVKHNANQGNCMNMLVQTSKNSFIIKENRLLSADYFSFNISDAEYKILDKIKNNPANTYLAQNAVFALGIVTGNNKKFISPQKTTSNEIILKGSDICKYKPKEITNYIEFVPEAFQQVAPKEYYRAPEKLLYRFICNQLVFSYDNKQTLSLNSCNIVIPQIEGLSVKYILAILNSRIAQFYFKKTFNSVKVLRSHIEQIPIPFIKKEQQQEFISYIDTLIATHLEENLASIYDELDQRIADLYNLDRTEYEVIKESMQGENLFLS